MAGVRQEQASSSGRNVLFKASQEVAPALKEESPSTPKQEVRALPPLEEPETQRPRERSSSKTNRLSSPIPPAFNSPREDEEGQSIVDVAEAELREVLGVDGELIRYSEQNQCVASANSSFAASHFEYRNESGNSSLLKNPPDRPPDPLQLRSLQGRGKQYRTDISRVDAAKAFDGNLSFLSASADQAYNVGSNGTTAQPAVTMLRIEGQPSGPGGEASLESGNAHNATIDEHCHHQIADMMSRYQFTCTEKNLPVQVPVSVRSTAAPPLSNEERKQEKDSPRNEESFHVPDIRVEIETETERAEKRTEQAPASHPLPPQVPGVERPEVDIVQASEEPKKEEAPAAVVEESQREEKKLAPSAMVPEPPPPLNKPKEECDDGLIEVANNYCVVCKLVQAREGV